MSAPKRDWFLIACRIGWGIAGLCILLGVAGMIAR